MNAVEMRATWSLASLFAFRMLGLFMVLPVFAIYGQSLTGATPALIGLAMGAYGLSQALLQVPFGYLSDRVGRKQVICFGLVLFGLGSVVAALSHSIEGVILGRLLQGAGAISGAAIALLSDLTRDDQRSKAMAFMGISIGLSFTLALIMGPLVTAWFDLAGVFWLTAGLAVVGIWITLKVVPEPGLRHLRMPSLPVWNQFAEVFRQPELMRLNLGVFVLHLAQTAGFVVMPVLLVQHAGIDKAEHWKVYLPILFISFVLMLPMMIAAEKRRQVKQMFLLAIALVLVAMLLLGHWHETGFALMAGLFVFFWGFNLLEAMLPSLVSKVSAPGSKGTAMGIYSTCQFLGAFVGGAGGGWLAGAYGPSALYAVAAALLLVWLLLALGMRPPRSLSDYTLQLGTLDAAGTESLTRRLLAVNGVEEVLIVPQENAAYLKVDNRLLDKAQLQEVAAAL